ncbi:hypothetical protein Tco_0689351, partial [Tanacetum coccineum]
MSSIKKTSVVHEKTMTPRSCLRWKPTGKIFKTVGLMWVPTGKIFTSSTTKVDSEPTNGSNDDITNQYECKQTLDVSAVQTPEIHDHSNELSRSKLVPKVVPPADKTATSRQELELLFHHHITMLRQNMSKKHQEFKNHESSGIKGQDFRANSDIKDNSSEIKLQGRLLASFQDDAKYEARKEEKGRRIEDIDADAEVILINETQERQDEDSMFDTGVLDDDE